MSLMLAAGTCATSTPINLVEWLAGTSVTGSGPPNPPYPFAQISLSRGGGVSLYSGTNGTWHSDGSYNTGDDYQVRFNIVSGSGGIFTLSPTDTWLTLSEARSLSVHRETTGSAVYDVRVRIRDIATSTVLIDEIITFTVIVS